MILWRPICPSTIRPVGVNPQATFKLKAARLATFTLDMTWVTVGRSREIHCAASRMAALA